MLLTSTYLTDPTAHAGFWVPRLNDASRVRLSDLDRDALPAADEFAYYLWGIRRRGRFRPLYAGSGWARDRIRREANKLRGLEDLPPGTIEVGWVTTPDLGLARLAEFYAIQELHPSMNGGGFGSNLPGRNRVR